jgi:hypothetical protein
VSAEGLRKRLLHRYIESIMSRPEFVELRDRAFKDILIYGSVQESTYELSRKLIDGLRHGTKGDEDYTDAESP